MQRRHFISAAGNRRYAPRRHEHHYTHPTHSRGGRSQRGARRFRRGSGRPGQAGGRLQTFRRGGQTPRTRRTLFQLHGCGRRPRGLRRAGGPPAGSRPQGDAGHSERAERGEDHRGARAELGEGHWHEFARRWQGPLPQPRPALHAGRTEGVDEVIWHQGGASSGRLVGTRGCRCGLADGPHAGGAARNHRSRAHRERAGANPRAVQVRTRRAGAGIQPDRRRVRRETEHPRHARRARG